MATALTITELRKMTLEDLRREARELRTSVAKTRLDIELKKEKNAAKVRMQRRMLARMLTVLAEKVSGSTPGEKAEKKLKTGQKTRTVPAPAAS